jgi:hypothetical protein
MYVALRPFFRRKYLLTPPEKHFYNILRQVVGRNTILAKVRLADLVDADKRHRLWRANFNRVCSKHIDFVICDLALSPIIAVELDDSSTACRIERPGIATSTESWKSHLCPFFAFPSSEPTTPPTSRSSSWQSFARPANSFWRHTDRKTIHANRNEMGLNQKTFRMNCNEIGVDGKTILRRRLHDKTALPRRHQAREVIEQRARDQSDTERKLARNEQNRSSLYSGCSTNRIFRSCTLLPDCETFWSSIRR